MPNIEQELSSKVVFRGSLFTLRTAFVTLPDGRRVTREVMERPSSVNVVAVDKKKNVYLIEEYRIGIQKTALRLPGGKVEQGETPRHAALRELYEETGIKAKKLSLLYDYHGGGSWKWDRFLYLARDITLKQRENPDDEPNVLRCIPLRKAARLALDGEIPSADWALPILRAYEIIMRRKLI
ncbi:MAG: NUDIX hydrolase [Candidatus Nomurabacteria bacterium]|nr:MAG: NUDIX hydrolase [Candidatus Nomurabacteria bacterium]